MQRSDERESESDLDVDTDVDVASLLDEEQGESSARASTSPDETARTSDGGGRLRGLLPTAPTTSVRSFLLVLALSVAGVVVGGSIPIVGSIGRFLGLFAVAFAIGLAGSRRRYLEVGVAGAVAAGFAFVLGTLTSVFAPVAVSVLSDFGLAIAGVGVGGGLLVSLLGHYFGRDLRSGLTRDV
ncbi:MAG: hypothetical protein ABEI27_04195 [Halobellus sp.]|uniref:hypothetical protein n=1 Tax=Halobellus sp. TaxID=1979212 RepID=UPI0035D4F924